MGTDRATPTSSHRGGSALLGQKKQRGRRLLLHALLGQQEPPHDSPWRPQPRDLGSLLVLDIAGFGQYLGAGEFF